MLCHPCKAEFLYLLLCTYAVACFKLGLYSTCFREYPQKTCNILHLCDSLSPVYTALCHDLFLLEQQSKAVLSVNRIVIADISAYLGKAFIAEKHLFIVVFTALIISEDEVLLQLLLVVLQYILDSFVFTAAYSAFEFEPCVLDVSKKLLHIVVIQLQTAVFKCH